jgi:hypothetical protein
MKLIQSKRLLKTKVLFSKLIKTFLFKTLLTSVKQTVCEKMFSIYYSFDTEVIFRIKNFSHSLIHETMFLQLFYLIENFNLFGLLF